MKEYQIKVTSVDYSVTYEDIEFDPYDTAFEDDATIEANEKKADQMIADIKASLPQELDLEITCEPEDLESEIAEAISNETNWLNNSFTYNIVSEREIDDDYDDEDEDDEDETHTLAYFNMEVEVIEENGKKYVYLANDGSSGCEYEFKTKAELRKLVADYAADMIESEYED